MTLEHSFTVANTMPSRGVSQTTYAVNGIFLGHHVDEELAKFSSVHLEISDLDNWVGLKGTEESFDWGRSGDRPLYSFSFTPSEHPVATFDRGAIELKSMWKQGSPQPRMIGFHTWSAFGLTYDEPQTFDAVMKDVSRIRDLTTLCIDAPAIIDKLIVRRDDIRETMLDGETDAGPRAIEYRAPFLNYVPPADRKPREWHRMLLTFEQLGGIATVARWLDIVPAFQYALNSMMSINNTKQMFGENRFLNVTNGAESFHRLTIGGGQFPGGEFANMVADVVLAAPERYRDWLGRRLEYANDPTLTKRLKELAGTGGAAVKPLIGNKDKWAHAISKTRNLLTHMGEGGFFSGGDLRHLTDSVYSVTRVCMLRQAGVPIATLESIAESDNTIWYRDRLHEAIERVRAEDAAPRPRRSDDPDGTQTTPTGVVPRARKGTVDITPAPNDSPQEGGSSKGGSEDSKPS